MTEVLITIRRILGWCVVWGFALLFVWTGAFFLGRDLITGQGGWFGLTPHEVALVAYCGMGFAKILILVFFFFPYLSIRIVQRKIKG